MSQHIDWESIDTIEKVFETMRTLTAGERWCLTEKELTQINVEIRVAIGACERMFDKIAKAKKRAAEAKAAEAAEQAEGKQPKGSYLVCCCCGGGTRGRQWWSRDTGYGLCDECISYVGADAPVGMEVSGYGIRGWHYDVNNPAAKSLKNLEPAEPT